MRLATISLLLLLPLVAACDSSPQPPANSTAGTKPAATKPAAAVPASFPITARPMLGTWASDGAACAEPAKVTTVTATSYDVGGKTCELALKANQDGSFAATCGKQNMTLTPIFGPSGEGIRVAIGDAKPANVFRCKR